MEDLDPSAGDAGLLGQPEVHDSLGRGTEFLELSDDDVEQAPPGPDDAIAPPRGVFDALVHGPRVSPGIRPHPPAPPPPRPPPSSCGPVAFRPSRDRMSSWPKVDHSLNPGGGRNYLRLSVTFGTSHFTCRAICTAHNGVPCSMTKSMRYHRPIGQLWAWLEAGHGLSKDQHACVVPSFEQRRRARQEFEALADVGEMLTAECGGVGLGEPQDTW